MAQRGRGRPAGGVTLVELLVTISIVAILMMAGVGVYWRMNRGFALQSAVSSIESALRAARAFAIHERSPATVVAGPPRDDPKLVGRVHALGRQTVSCWHFEKEQFGGTSLKGALGQEGTLPVAATHAPGRIGRALLLNGSSTCVEVTSPYLDGLREGVFIDCYVLPDPTGLNQDDVLPIACKDVRAVSNYALDLVYGGDGLFALEARAQIENSGGTQAVKVTSELVVRAGEWTHVAMAYYRDRNAEGGGVGRVALEMNGEDVGREEVPLTGTGLLAVNTAKLHIGADGTSYFKGRIDELRIAGLVAGETHQLPKNTEVTVDIGGSKDGRVHFDSEGKLDPKHHSGVVLFRVISREDRLLRVVRVNWLGSVEMFQTEPPEGE